MKNELQTITEKKQEQDRDISLSTMHNPEVFTELSNIIKEHVKENKLTVNIQGSDYPMVEAWQFTGALLGIVPLVRSCERVPCEGTVKTKYEERPIIKYQARCELLNTKTGEIVGNGFAICSNEERKKRSFDEYAVASMAQTRAIGKAFRAMLGWIFGSLGYKTTPWEEMEPILGADNVDDVKMEFAAFAEIALQHCQAPEQVTELSKSCQALHKDKKLMKQFRSRYDELTIVHEPIIEEENPNR